MNPLHREGLFIVVFLLGVAAYALAEELTLTTSYPHPLGVYRELRTVHTASLATSRGVVGIGTATPPPATEKLHVQGNVSIEGGQLQLGALSGDSFGIGDDPTAMGPGALYYNTEADNVRLYQATGEWVNLGDGPWRALGSNMMYSELPGNVGVGTAGAPAANAKLHVQGTLMVDNQAAGSPASLSLEALGGGKTSTVGQLPADPSTLQLAAGPDFPDDPARLTVDSRGRVGILTETPQALLDVTYNPFTYVPGDYLATQLLLENGGVEAYFGHEDGFVITNHKENGDPVLWLDYQNGGTVGVWGAPPQADLDGRPVKLQVGGSSGWMVADDLWLKRTGTWVVDDGMPTPERWYGLCVEPGCTSLKAPASCSASRCACPSGYELYELGNSASSSVYSCYRLPAP